MFLGLYPENEVEQTFRQSYIPSGCFKYPNTEYLENTMQYFYWPKPVSQFHVYLKLAKLNFVLTLPPS